MYVVIGGYSGRAWRNMLLPQFFLHSYTHNISATVLGSIATARFGVGASAMFQSRYVTPPPCPPDGFYADTSVHLEIDDPARAGNWLLAFLRGRCAFVRIDFIKCTVRARLIDSVIKVRMFFDPRNNTPVSIEFQLYPNGKVDEFMALFSAAKDHLEQAAATASIVRFYAANYVRMGRLERVMMPVHHAPPIDDFYDLPPVLDNIEEVD